MNILFVEDNPDFSGPASDVLEALGHAVTVVDSADAFVEIEEKLANFDLAIIDVMMRLGTKIQAKEAPETGIAIFRRLRRRHPRMPVLFLTALARREIAEIVQFDNITGYHGKPIPRDTSSLENVIKEITRK